MGQKTIAAPETTPAPDIRPTGGPVKKHPGTQKYEDGGASGRPDVTVTREQMKGREERRKARVME